MVETTLLLENVSSEEIFLSKSATVLCEVHWGSVLMFSRGENTQSGRAHEDNSKKLFSQLI